MGVYNPGKVRNRRVAKLRIFLIIINVGRTLVLGLPQKQNGRPIGYITLLTLTSRPKRTLSHIRELLYGVLPIAKLAQPLLVSRHTCKVPNRKVAKSNFLLLLVLVPGKNLRSHDSVIIVGFTLKNYTNQLRLLVSSAFLY